jgi:hypothetical protein
MGIRQDMEIKPKKKFIVLGISLSLLFISLSPIPFALAQQKAPLAAKLNPASLRARTTAPMAVEVKLTWQGKQLLEGKLQLVLLNRGDVVGRYLSSDMALRAGEQRFRLLLPAIRADGSNTEVQVKMHFVTKSATFNLGEAMLSCPTWMQRSLIICIGETETGRTRRLRKIVGSMWLERFNPGEPQRSKGDLNTLPTYMEPEDLPAFSIGYCCFDIVYLPPSGFSVLRRKQLEALARWVEAGGSACVCLGRKLKKHHVDFLNNLSGASKDKPKFFLNFEGKLETAVSAENIRLLLYRPGLGRLAVIHEALDEKQDLDSPGWRKAVAFLWKVRARYLGIIVSKGTWPKATEDGDYGSGAYGGVGWASGYGTYQRQFQVMPVAIGGDLLDTLIPQTISTIPFWAIVVILILFVIAIGPLDYFVLGFLKRRRLTWAVFPLLSVGFTLFTVFLSESYMGGADHRTAAVFVDLGRDGRVLRQSRFEVIFTARHKEIVNEIKGGLFCPLAHGRFRGYYGGGSWAPDEGGSAPLWYVGRIPEHYTVTQTVRQWSPQLNRHFSMNPHQSSINLNWDAVSPETFKTFEGRSRLKQLLLGNKTVDARICLFNGSETHHIHGQRYMFPITVLRQCCVRKPEGLFSVISQISPTGADNFEDLTVLDATNPNQWLLVVVVREGRDYIIYRRLYYGDEK